jgi:hypothetical protein
MQVESGDGSSNPGSTGRWPVAFGGSPNEREAISSEVRGEPPRTTGGAACAPRIKSPRYGLASTEYA